MKTPKAMNLYLDMTEEFGELSFEQVGRVVMAALNYASTGEMPDFSGDIAAKLMFKVMKKQIDRDFASYREVCEKRKAAASSRYRKDDTELQMHANASNCRQEKEEEKEENKNDYKEEYKDEYKEENEEKKDGRAQSADCRQGYVLEYLPDIYDIVDHLNGLAGTNYRRNAQETVRLLTGLFNDGYTAADVMRVIDLKCAEWKDSPYEKFLRPSTLFGEKFESYLNAPPVKSAREQGGTGKYRGLETFSATDLMKMKFKEMEDNYEVPEFKRAYE